MKLKFLLLSIFIFLIVCCKEEKKEDKTSNSSAKITSTIELEKQPEPFKTTKACYDKSSAFTQHITIPNDTTINIANNAVKLELSLKETFDISKKDKYIIMQIFQYDSKDYKEPLKSSLKTRTINGSLELIIKNFNPQSKKEVIIFSIHDQDILKLKEGNKDKFTELLNEIKGTANLNKDSLKQIFYKYLNKDGFIEPTVIGTGTIPPSLNGC